MLHHDPHVLAPIGVIGEEPPVEITGVVGHVAVKISPEVDRVTTVLCLTYAILIAGLPAHDVVCVEAALAAGAASSSPAGHTDLPPA